MSAPKRFKPNPPEDDGVSEESNPNASDGPTTLDQSGKEPGSPNGVPKDESHSSTEKPSSDQPSEKLQDNPSPAKEVIHEREALPRLEDALMEVSRGNISPEWENENTEDEEKPRVSPTTWEQLVLCRAPRKRKRLQLSPEAQRRFSSHCKRRLFEDTPAAAAESIPAETVGVDVIPETSAPPSTAPPPHQPQEDQSSTAETAPESTSPTTAHSSNVLPSKDVDTKEP